jgi:hypothetical protein
MRLGLTIFLLVLSVASRSQTLSDTEERLRLLTNKEKWRFDTTGFSILPRFNHRCDINNESPFDYYHVLDLNMDGKKDLIYSGPCNPYSQTTIFLNDGLKLKPIHDYPGLLVSIETKADSKSVNIFKESIACDRFSELIQVTIFKDSRIETNQITFDATTKIQTETLSEIRVKGVLRTTPELDDKGKEDDCSGQAKKGNHLLYLDKLTSVIELKREGHWRLILYPMNRMNSWIGWISVE